MRFLGLDLGTTGVRAVLIDESGTVVGSSSSEHPLHSPAPGWMEQDPLDWWVSACAAIRGVLAGTGAEPGEVDGVAASGQMHGAVLLDTSGSPVRPCILWNDQRSAAQCTQMVDMLGAQRLLDLTGNLPLAGFTAPKLLWVREHEPAAWARVATVLLPRDYLNYRLTGVLACEPSDAAGTLLFDVHRRGWSAEVCAALGLDQALLPAIVQSAAMVGRVGQAAAQATGLREGTPVLAGGADNACAAAGSGVLEPGQVLCSVGTSGTVLAPVDLEANNPGHNLHLFAHVSPRTNYVMGVVLSAGGALRWFRDTCYPDLVAVASAGGTDAYSAITSEAELVQPGAEGLLFLPYLTGERTPHGSAVARGVFFGLSPRHGRPHMARAVIEGACFALGQSLDLLRGAGIAASTVRLTGGGAKSRFWQQTLADVFDYPVSTQVVDEGPAYGAALLAAAGCGVTASIEAAGSRVQSAGMVEPRRGVAALYRQSAALFADLYGAVGPLFGRLVDLQSADSGVKTA